MQTAGDDNDNHYVDIIHVAQSRFLFYPKLSPRPRSFLALAPRVERLQWINLATLSPDNPLSSSTLDKFPAPWLGHIQADKANILWFPTTWQQVVWDVLQMRLYACGVVEGLIMTEMREGFRVFLKL
jgi:hypothetical protein